MEWKIVDSDKASKLHIGTTSTDERDFLIIDIAYIPREMNVEEYIRWIQDNKIVLLDSVKHDRAHEEDRTWY